MRDRALKSARIICRHLSSTKRSFGSFVAFNDYCRHSELAYPSENGSRTFASGTSAPDYSSLRDPDASDVSFFQSVVGKGNVLTDPDVTAAYLVDWLKKYKSPPQCVVVRPGTVEEIQKILAYCNANKIGVVPQGGNTGLVGGSVPHSSSEIVLSLQRLKNIISFDESGGVLVCQAGCVLEDIEKYVNPLGYTIPLDLAAKGTCQIGGNLATNAGGVRLLRYGSLHGTVVGIEAVLPDGSLIDNLTTLRKDNTGYDLKQLFIGAEGTLGVITKVAILTPPLAKATNVSFLSLHSFADVLAVMKTAKEMLGEILSAFEMMDGQSVALATKYLPVRSPFGAGPESPFYVLIETRGSNAVHDNEKLTAFLETITEKGFIADGTIAQSEQQAKELWAVREGIPQGIVKVGAVYKYDVSLPLPQFYELVVATRLRLEAAKRDGDDPPIVTGFGHIGDGNLHLNISVRKYDKYYEDLLEPFVYEFVSSHRGSISAEHGIGLMKRPMLFYSKSAESIALMKKIKNLMDPNHIMNPHKVLPR